MDPGAVAAAPAAEGGILHIVVAVAEAGNPLVVPAPVAAAAVEDIAVPVAVLDQEGTAAAAAEVGPVAAPADPTVLVPVYLVSAAAAADAGREASIWAAWAAAADHVPAQQGIHRHSPVGGTHRRRPAADHTAVEHHTPTTNTPADQDQDHPVDAADPPQRTPCSPHWPHSP